jgi:hypothetical protein
MPVIPITINGVNVVFAPNVNNDVTSKMVAALKAVILPGIAPGHELLTIYISSARRKQPTASNHPYGRAIDVSRINGIRIDPGFTNDPSVRVIVKAIQTAFESTPNRRENYGPAFLKKSGALLKTTNPAAYEKLAPMHQNHIHMSVDA